jgi:hypothetical protein
MTTTEKTVAPDATADSSREIGIHIKLPPLCFWLPCAVECLMLTQILCGALDRRSLLVKRLQLVAFEGQIFGLGIVSNIPQAAATVAQQLDILGLIPGAHLAWLEPQYGWKTERPLPEPAPFQSRIDAFMAWRAKEQNFAIEQAERLQSLAAKMVGNLKKGLPPLAP